MASGFKHFQIVTLVEADFEIKVATPKRMCALKPIKQTPYASINTFNKFLQH